MDALIAFKFGFNNDLIFNFLAISKILFKLDKRRIVVKGPSELPLSSNL